MSRVVTGYRPTGKLHLGHLLGNLRTMRDLVEEHQCWFFIADWHALTTGWEDTASIARDTHDLVLDWIAAGIDPFRATIYRQSDVPEVAELALLLSMITPLSWLERNPTYKEQLRELSGREIATHGHVGYPVLQCADIAIVGGELVPVGSDQLPHLELSREIIRRFNRVYGDVFPEPEALMTSGSKVPGPDGRKMSKSYGNDIPMDAEPAELASIVKTAVTDPAKIHLGDPGTPEVCTVHAWWSMFFPDETPAVETGCRAGTLGCMADKDAFSERLSGHLQQFRERRAELAAKPDIVEQVLSAGRAKIRPVATEAMARVREAMKLA